MSPSPSPGRVRGLHTSQGGVPKTPVSEIEVRVDGIDGDVQRDLRHHGGPTRAVCLLAHETLEALRAAGHPIAPGTTGENLLVEGVGEAFPPGTLLRFEGGVILEVTAPAAPCSNIRASFHDGDPRHLSVERPAGHARYYARVETTGRIVLGESVWRTAPPDTE